VTIFVVVLAVLYVSVRMRNWLRDRYVPWYETRLQERAQGLPRGSLAERWQTPGNGMADEEWISQLRRFNQTNRILRQR
jgi:hypothetical protein